MVHASGGTAMTSDEALKKFGNAKAISSDMYFNRSAEMDVRYDSRSTLKSTFLSLCTGHVEVNIVAFRGRNGDLILGLLRWRSGLRRVGTTRILLLRRARA